MHTEQQGGSTTDVRARVIVCTDREAAANKLAAALANAGFEATTSSLADLADVADIADRANEANEAKPAVVPAIVVVADSTDGWLRDVSDLAKHPAGMRPFVLASKDDPDVFLAALAAGAAGYCSASASIDAIVRSIESVERTGYAIPRSMTGPLVDHVRHGRGHSVSTAAGPIEVTDREWEILSLLVQRRSTRDMAESLYVSVGTVRSHISTLLKKLGAVDRDDAVQMIERGRRAPKR